MLSIDEAIEKYKEITNTKAICPGHCNISCDKCLQESKQIAEWLEELKANKVTSAEVYEQGYNRGYSKAIDDFVNEIKAFQDQDEPLYNILWDEIAEQLKEGGENE